MGFVVDKAAPQQASGHRTYRIPLQIFTPPVLRTPNILGCCRRPISGYSNKGLSPTPLATINRFGKASITEKFLRILCLLFNYVRNEACIL